MKLVTARDAVDFLSQAAPRVWVKSMLKAMIQEYELDVYFLGGWVRSEVMVAEYLSNIEGIGLVNHSTERDLLVRAKYGDEVADRISGLDWTERVIEHQIDLELDGGLGQTPPWFFVFGQVDWDTGTLKCPSLPSKVSRHDEFFWGAEDLIWSDFHSAEFTALFEGMSFSYRQIELLLPTHSLAPSAVAEKAEHLERRTIGRPPRWDWISAAGHAGIEAQKAGLSGGKPGDQARIEEIMAQWFIDESGDQPSQSQIRSHAARLIQMFKKVDNAKKGH